MGAYVIIEGLSLLAPIPLGIAVLVAQGLISGRRDPLRDDPVNLIITIVGWVLIATGFVFPLAGLLGIFTVVLVFLGVFVLVEGLRKRKASQQNALLWILVVSAERFMPLGPAVEAFARERGGLFGWRAKRLAALLAAGVPLPDALALCPRMVPAYALPMVRIGCQSGGLALALRKAATVHNQNAPVWMSLIGKVSYLLPLPILGPFLFVFVMVWIIPKYSMIFKDFGMSLPPMTQCLIESGYFFVNYWYLFSPLILLFLGLMLYALVRYFGLTQWDPPVLRRLVRRLDSANVLDGLAVMARQQQPLGEGVATLAIAYPKRDIRRRLALATFEIEAGSDWAESLCQHSLIRSADLAVLQAAQRVGNLPWAMQEMADSARRRFFYKLQAIVQSAFPAVVICFGAVVMFVVVALFLPLVSIIQRMAT